MARAGMISIEQDMLMDDGEVARHGPRLDDALRDSVRRFKRLGADDDLIASNFGLTLDDVRFIVVSEAAIDETVPAHPRR